MDYVVDAFRKSFLGRRKYTGQIVVTDASRVPQIGEFLEVSDALWSGDNLKEHAKYRGKVFAVRTIEKRFRECDDNGKLRDRGRESGISVCIDICAENH